MAHRDDHVHLPHGQGGPLPLAVLRPVRGRLDLRLRRPDADDRLHGRLPERGLAMATSAARLRRRTTGATTASASSSPGSSLSVDRHAARRARPRPGAPAGERQRAGGGAGRSTTPADDRDRHADHLPAPRLLRATRSRRSARARRRSSWTGRRSADDARIQILWIVITSVDRALPRRLRDVRAAPDRLGRRPGPEARSSCPSGPEAAGAGDRAAVGVHVPLPDLRRRRDAARSCSRRTR